MISFLRALLIFSFVGLAVRAAEPRFLPLGSGSLGSVSAKDGDSDFDAAYFAGDKPTGKPVAVRLEAAVGSQSLPPSVNGAYTARWTGTITPSQSGAFPVSLRTTGVALVTIDGRVVLRRAQASADFNVRMTKPVEMLRGRPYEFVVEFHHTTGAAQIALEWAAPTGPVAATTEAKPVETEAGPVAGTAIGAATHLENAHYSLDTRADGALVVTQKSTGAHAMFAPTFAVVAQAPGHESKLAPKGGKYEDDGPVGDTNYLVPVWDKETDFLTAAQPRARLHAESATTQEGKVAWRFPAQAAYELTATIDLPADGSEPRLTWQLTPKTAGQFSVGYVGAPATPFAQTAWIWQPLVWQDRRFPNRSYLTPEYECPLPFTLVGQGADAVGVGADPHEMPYRMPTYDNSRFGVLVRNAAGQAQSQLFAPVLGGVESAMKPGQPYAFALRLYVGRGAWFDAYKQLAESLYQFNDYRESTTSSLNTTIEHLTDFVLNDQFCYWYPRYKTWGYQNDGGPGAGRQQSAGDAVSLALVFDRQEFLDRRARPTLEYFLSRNTVSTNFTHPEFMGGHVNNASDFTAVFRLTGGRNTVIRELFAPSPGGADTGKRPPLANRNPIFAARTELATELTNYWLTGDRAALARARAAADRYIASRIDQPVTDYHDHGSSFWTELAPAYDLLYKLYQETNEPRYLAAAAAAMRQFTAFEYLVPVIPAGNFTANPGGLYNGQPVPEEIVPAWQVSANGLAPECAATAHSHRGVFMASYAAWMTRLARDAAEPFFRDISRSAVVGRYANYPSYAYRNGYTTVHQKADYPLRSFEEIKKFTSAHYNHPLPMTAFLVDYLVSDIYARSDAKVTFPADYTNTGAYFRNQLYGAHAGQFYDDRGVWLWLPKHLVAADSVQVNYVAARGNGRLYLALSNQAPRAITTALAIDPARVALAGKHHARVWIDNQPAAAIEIIDGHATVAISPKGITCLAIDDATITTEIQDAMLAPDSPPLPAGASRAISSPFGDVTATALRFGRGLTSVHVWLKSGPERVQRATLVWLHGGKIERRESAEFPFEFTVPVADDLAKFECHVEAQTSAGLVTSGSLAIALQ